MKYVALIIFAQFLSGGGSGVIVQMLRRILSILEPSGDTVLISRAEWLRLRTENSELWGLQLSAQSRFKQMDDSIASAKTNYLM